MISRIALRGPTQLSRMARRNLASVTSDAVRDASGPALPPMNPSARLSLNSKMSFTNGLTPYRRGFPSLNEKSYIRFNPSSDPSFVGQREIGNFVSSLQKHFDSLPVDPNAPVSAGRFRQYSRAFVLPFEDEPRVYWAPGHVREDNVNITYYNQGTCSLL